MIIYAFGKPDSPYIKGLIEEIQKRFRVEVVFLKEYKDKNTDKIKEKEFEEIRNRVKGYKVLLTERGKLLSTEEFCDFVRESKMEAGKNLCFIISGPHGPSQNLEDFCDFKLALSKMTFTHEMALYILIEQLYRCECIRKNKPYHK